MERNQRVAYFDGIADKWDGWEEDPRALRQRLREWLQRFAVARDERVLDVGCGTGNLTAALLEMLGEEGRVVAVDISPGMLRVARGKIEDPRVSWLLADVARLPQPAADCTRAICYSVWPHFPDRRRAARELWRVLRPGGRLHVWHLLGREQVNRIHATAGPAVSDDVLPPAEQTATLLAEEGFSVQKVVDDANLYLVTASKPET